MPQKLKLFQRLVKNKQLPWMKCCQQAVNWQNWLMNYIFQLISLGCRVEYYSERQSKEAYKTKLGFVMSPLIG